MSGNLHEEFMKVVHDLVKHKIKSEHIYAAILGGSVARGDETEHSDIDIAFCVNKKDMPKDPRRFYKFRGKYIEEHYSEIENIDQEKILPEEKIIYDKTGKIKKKNFDEKTAKGMFRTELQRSRKSQELSEKQFKKGNYEESFNSLYGAEGPAFILMHALPPRFNLPFPSFKLLNSLKIIDRKCEMKIYAKIEEIYNFENHDWKRILKIFRKAYLLMNKIKSLENPDSKNLGFFDKIKIRYNVDGLKETFQKYPFVFAYRFIVGCLTAWTFEKNIGGNERARLHDFLLGVLGINEIGKGLVKDKLKLSRELIDEAEKLE